MSGWRCCLLLAVAMGSPSPSGPCRWSEEPRAWLLPADTVGIRGCAQAWSSARAGALQGLLLVAPGHLCDGCVTLCHTLLCHTLSLFGEKWLIPKAVSGVSVTATPARTSRRRAGAAGAGDRGPISVGAGGCWAGPAATRQPRLGQGGVGAWERQGTLVLQA